ncbi:hypothetical protein [Ancylobacter sp. IITR112]|uniref:hypothetical protein n=1 Tax=Ancylobacter sp. IITR112 TaxID=3138073 RepID=UPI00352B8BE5
MIESASPLFSSDAFLGAVVGGFLAAAGSIIALCIQQFLQGLERRKTAKAVFLEHGQHFQQLLEKIVNHHQARGEIWFEYVNQVDIVFGIVNRNLEWIALLKKSDSKSELRSYFSEAYYATKRAQFLQTRFYEKSEILKKSIDDDKSEIISEIRDINTEIRNAIIEIKRIHVDHKLLFSN